MIIKKVCLVGARAVGKSSLVQHFAQGVNSGDYVPTSGAKISKKELKIEGESLRLMLWDIAGFDNGSTEQMRYLRGAAAIIYVVDGMRRETLATALEVRREVETAFGKRAPGIMLFNKFDKLSQWQVSADDIGVIEAGGMITLCTSVKDGNGINTAFSLICRLLLGKTAIVAA